jgi:hypothetical protein
LLHDINNNNKVGGNYIRNFVWLWHFEHKSRLYVDGTFWYFQAIQLISQPVHIVPRPAQLVQVKTQSPLKATKLNALSLIYIYIYGWPIDLSCLVRTLYCFCFFLFLFSESFYQFHSQYECAEKSQTYIPIQISNCVPHWE